MHSLPLTKLPETLEACMVPTCAALLAFFPLHALAVDAPVTSQTNIFPDRLVEDSEEDASPSDEPAPLALATEEDSEEEPARRGYMELGFRGRHMSVPNSLLDIWYFSERDEGLDEPRPKVQAYGLGLEFVIKTRPEEDSVGSSNGIFYFDWLSNLTSAGYWDDVEDPADHADGDYVVPSKDLGLLVLGADYAYEIHMVRTAQTKGNFGLSLLVGAGIGVGVLLGDLEYWSSEGGVPAYERFANGADPEGDKRIPKVLPVLDINVGLRFNFADRFVIRAEGGFHDMFYMGGSMGVMF